MNTWVSCLASSCFITWLWVSSALAATEPCTVDHAAKIVSTSDADSGAKALVVWASILKQFHTILGKSKSSTEPLSLQISGADAEKFGELRQQLQQVMFYSVMQSSRTRDADVVAAMNANAWKLFTSPDTDISDDPTKDPGYFLLVLRALLPSAPDYVPSTDTNCTLDLALSMEQAKVVQQISIDGAIVSKDAPVMDAIRAKYGFPAGSKIDQAKLSPDDAQTVNIIRVQVQPAMSDISLATDLQNIRDWWGIAQLKYTDDLYDMEMTSDPNNIGDTFSAQPLSPRNEKLFKLWSFVNSQLPCELSKQMQEVISEYGLSK
jgi:hypothetical protein